MTIAFKSILWGFGLEENFNGTCLGHAFSKTYKYAIAKERVCKSLKYVLIKFVQFNIQKYITWPKHFRKGNQECMKACIEFGIWPRKLNTPVKIK
jgi:hypothetical protein